MHRTIDPAILYFGTPVVIISTLNPDGNANLAPMSSAWWLGDRCMLGLDPTSQTPRNLQRTGECVLNLPSVEQLDGVNRLALTTGTSTLPPHKRARGYRPERDKFRCSGFTPIPAECVEPPRVAECPVHLEAVLESSWPAAPPLGTGGVHHPPFAWQVRVVRVHVDEGVVMPGHPNRIDPDRWRPLIMSFQHFYGLGPRLGDSRLAKVPEEHYRRPGSAGAENASVSVQPAG
jgi:flavin reductase (DIM6/NTAB) family NADH-FMN oxidoreductase RutF